MYRRNNLMCTHSHYSLKKERETTICQLVIQLVYKNTQKHIFTLPAASRALLGDPQGPSRQKVYLTCVTQSQVLDAERSTSTAEKLATALLLLLFSTDEIAHGNCTQPIRGDIKQLDSEKLWAIKCKNIVLISKM